MGEGVGILGFRSGTEGDPGAENTYHSVNER